MACEILFRIPTDLVLKGERAGRCLKLKREIWYGQCTGNEKITSVPFFFVFFMNCGQSPILRSNSKHWPTYGPATLQIRLRAGPPLSWFARGTSCPIFVEFLQDTPNFASSAHVPLHASETTKGFSCPFVGRNCNSFRTTAKRTGRSFPSTILNCAKTTGKKVFNLHMFLMKYRG